MQGFRKHFWLIGAAAVYLILAVVRIVGINSRSELHADEVYSLMLARCNPAYFAPLPADTVFTGAEIKAQLVVNHPLGHDLAQLYLNNGDAPHASLYYMALRLALCGMDGFDAHELAVRGGLLNLIFWTVAFWAMWSLCRSLFGRIRYGDVIVLATLIIAFGIPLSLRCTMLVREYQMAEMFVILFSLTSACICRYVMARRCVPTRLWCFLALAVAGVISTGYLNSIYVFLLMTVMFAVGIRAGYPRIFLPLLAAGLGGIAVAFALYLGYFNFILYPSVHTAHAFQNFDHVLGLVFGSVLTHSALRYAGTVALGLILLVVICDRHRRRLVSARYQWWLPVIAIATMVLIEYASLLRQERYIYPYISIVALIFPLICCAVRTNWRHCAAIAIAFYVLAACISRPEKIGYGWGSMRSQLSHGAIFYSLNPNELPLLSPVLNDTAAYYLVSDSASLAKAITNSAGGLTLTADTTPAEPPLPIISRKPLPITTKSSSTIISPLKIHTPVPPAE